MQKLPGASAKEAEQALHKLVKAARDSSVEIDRLEAQLEQDRKRFWRWLPVAVLFGLVGISTSFYLASN